MQRLKSNPKGDLEKETLMSFKRYIKGLDGRSLRKLVHFLIGSDVIVVQKIDIAYYKADNGSFLELPNFFNNFYELRE